MHEFVFANSTTGRRMVLREIRDRPSNEYKIRGMNDISNDEETVILTGDKAITYVKNFPGSLEILEL